MDKEEFLFLIPGVLYGIAVFDLLSLVRNKKTYWESILWAMLLFFALIAIMFNLYEDLVTITSNIYYYTLFIFSPILFVQCCYLISPTDVEDDMKEVFTTNRKTFFMSLTGVIAVNLLIHVLVTNKTNYVQSLFFILIFGLSAFYDKVYLRLVAAAAIGFVIVATYIKLG
ncbi:MAG: hypothetical protein CL840_11305 [Crocinitomicaceae bacterium]|nr:hypothetical protein [Crocinitomicaceae bacterium]|tara:strand:+ start:9272 stop:9781 length:510 start_codon:yes stop_codon:yes gene_type:complete